MPSLLKQIGLGADGEAAFGRMVAASGHAPRGSNLGYDAINPKGKRRAPTGKLMFEERELMEQQRRLLVSGSRDLQRNCAIAAWAIRKHLDFVSTFNFHPQTDDEGLDRELTAFVDEASHKKNFDAAGRHGRQRFTRLYEGRACVDSDIFAAKIENGTVQGVEGDRIRNPLGQMDEVPDPVMGIIPRGLIQGIQIGPGGEAQAYAVHRRTLWGGFEFERLVPASDMWHHAFYDRFDQVRGVSPIAAALNSFQDVYENIDYALAKAKVAQLFGLVISRDASDALGGVGTATPEQSPDEEGNTVEGYKVDFGQGPIVLDLNDGDKAAFLENKTPSTEFKDFMTVVIGIALKSLDIPFSFYDEAYTNFFGSRAALNLYQMSTAIKQDALRWFLKEWLRWRLAKAIATRQFRLPRRLTVDTLPFEWLPSGIPWWNPKDEISSDLQSVEGFLNTRAAIYKARFGGDWFAMMRNRKKEDDLLRELGYNPSYSALASVPGSPLMTEDSPNDPAAADQHGADGERKPGEKQPAEKEAKNAKA